LGIVPTYQYECTECGAALEVHQSFSDDPLTTCPTCSGRLRKVYNAVGVVFKGPGFYRTDSRRPESKSDWPAAKPDKSATPKSAERSSSPAAT
jgi:putative FmdB family regulatory protein